MTVKNPTLLRKASKATGRIAEHYFSGRTAILASMHGKEKVLAPVLEEALKIRLEKAKGLDTDQFGTFTNDIPRPGSAYQTALMKIEAAKKLYPEETLFISSEGSFNAHPDTPFVTVNSEIVVLRDYHHDLEIVGTHYSMETTAAQESVSSHEDAIAFAVHNELTKNALVAKTNVPGRKKPVMIKGIRTLDALRRIITHLFTVSSNGVIELETDMRAFCNEQRMENIGKAAESLLQKINSLCPSCGWPGFDVTETQRGLLCMQCKMPTRMVKAHIYSCKKCGCTVGKNNQHTHLYADPMYCDNCNP